MRIVIDMQGAQTASRHRGIGRYTLGFAQAVARHRGEHELILLLNGLFPDTVQPIRDLFRDLLPRENILVWQGLGPVAAGPEGNEARRRIAEYSRESFIDSLRPDIVHICSLFEGYGDDAVVSIGRFESDVRVSVTLYDLIPLLNEEYYFNGKSRYKEFYFDKLSALKRADCLLAISEFSKNEGIDHLGLPADRFHCTYLSIDDKFRRGGGEALADIEAIRRRLRLVKSYVLYTGGADERKNLHRLLAAYAALPQRLRDSLQLVLAGKIGGPEMAALYNTIRAMQLRTDEVLFAGYVSDEDLIALYQHCKLFVFPSWHEGFGLPVLEAMACGAPVIAPNTSSLPEVVGCDEALFDPHDVQAISAGMQQALDDESMRARLREHGLQQASKFSWDEAARRAIAAWKATLVTSSSAAFLRAEAPLQRLLPAVAKDVETLSPTERLQLACALASNVRNGVVRQLVVEVDAIDALTMQQRIEVAAATDDLSKIGEEGCVAQVLRAGLSEWVSLTVQWVEASAEYFLIRTESRVRADSEPPLLWGFGDVLVVTLAMSPEERSRQLHALEGIHTRGVTILLVQRAADSEDSGTPPLSTHQQQFLHVLQRAPSSVEHSSLSDASASLAIRWATLLQRAGHARRQLLVDVSELVQRDARTGIQRVVRSILLEWLRQPPAQYRVEPVYATIDGPYRYARRFTRQFSAIGNDQHIEDDPIEYSSGDLFFGLDLQTHVATSHTTTYQAMRASGVRVSFLVYDLLPVRMPQYFETGAKEGFERWLDVVAENDGAIAISKAVADDLVHWIKEAHPDRLATFSLDWSHIGADIANSQASTGVPASASKTLDMLRQRVSFLMVGTIEPRKGHQQVLDAFELLWDSGADINLVVVGKLGWMSEELAARMKNHPRRGKSFFWLEGISDEYLEMLYGVCGCLIAASYGEGFGLPLIEAAQHGLPIIARDIPVFREVVGLHAFYFNAETPDQLAQALHDWLDEYKHDQHTTSKNMSWLTWKESAESLLQKILYKPEA